MTCCLGYASLFPSQIGQGTYSNVYRARDLEEGKVVALKKVKFDIFDPESICFMAREIHILRRLYHPNIIKLEGLVTSRTSYTLYLVFEYMEHDLVGLASRRGIKFTEPEVLMQSLSNRLLLQTFCDMLCVCVCSVFSLYLMSYMVPFHLNSNVVSPDQLFDAELKYYAPWLI